uniref:Retrovirus-related Pol polyprotein from transposon TNT 1-94 n=1 Tax=Tanacetum cinerariifolium TaxID=118510 RepID=A0A6L2LBV0_TANCI|nr:retrovirus-related Pol polyprotein from transposon TNT 1-94 [Tanacetum cinerariifolium]
MNSFSDEDITKEIYLNPLFDKEIISIKIDPHHFSTESDLIESLLNQDSFIISSSKIDSLLDEFTGELILLKSIPSRIDEADYDPEEEICLIEKLLYDNLSPRPPREFNSENFDVVIESFSPSLIPFEPLWRRSICFLLLMDRYPQTFLTPQLSSEFFLPSLPIRDNVQLKCKVVVMKAFETILSFAFASSLKLLAESTWDDLILYHEGPSDVKKSRVIDLTPCYNTFKFKEGETLTQTFTRYKALINELVNDGINLLKLEINTGFINGLPKKWLSFYQSLRNTNHVKYSELASLFRKLKYEENLIDSIYGTQKEKSLVSGMPLSTSFFSTSVIQDFQDSLDDEEDTRSSHDASPFKSTMVKNKGLIAEAYEWDEEEVLFDNNEMFKVKVLIALAEDNDAVSKEGAKNGKWVKISMRKGNKSSSALKVNSALAGKLKSVKIEDDPSLEREIHIRNPQHAFKRYEARGSSTHTTTDHYDIEWFKRGEELQAKKAEALKSTRAKSSDANSNEVSFKDPYDKPDLVVIEIEAPSNQNDHPAQENDIPNDNPPEHSNHNNYSPIIENIINAKAFQDSEPTSSPVEDASAQNIIPILNIPLDEFIKSSVENLVPNPSESEDERECDVPVCDDFTTFSNLLFDVDDDSSSSDDKSFSDEDIPKEIYSNPLFDEEIISNKIDPHHFNAESDVIESLLNQDSLIISSSNIDSLLDEFTGKLIFLKSISSGIDEADCDPEEEIRLIEKLLYENSSPRPPKEINSENSDAVIEYFSPSYIPVEDSDPFMEEID